MFRSEGYLLVKGLLVNRFRVGSRGCSSVSQSSGRGAGEHAWATAPSRCQGSLDAYLSHLGEIGQALEQLADAVLLQGAHPLVDGGPPDLLHVGPVQDELLDFLGGDEELVLEKQERRISSRSLASWS